jgi:hypothetical protein
LLTDGRRFSCSGHVRETPDSGERHPRQAEAALCFTFYFLGLYSFFACGRGIFG